MLRKLLVTAVTTASAVTAASAFAQAGSDVIEEIQIISNSRVSEGLGEVNASVSVLGDEELRLIRHAHYQEALNRLPGVSVHRNNGQESLMAIRSPVLTGAGACGSFLVAEQGIPVRASGFCNVNEMFDTHTENAERIEVIRGPGSAFWGSNAVHGLINVILPEAGERTEFGVEIGPRGSTRVKGAIGTDYGDFKQLLLVNGTKEEGYRDDSGVDQQKLSWLYSYTTDSGTEFDGGFTINNLNQETAGFVVGTDAFEDSNLRDTNPNPEAFRDSHSSRVWTRISADVEDWSIVLTPYFREVNMTFIQHFLPGQPVEDTEHRSIGLQYSMSRDLSDTSNIAFGLDWEDTSGNLLQFQPNPTQGSFFLRNIIPQGRHYDYEVEARQVAAFANYETRFGNGWELSLGLRYENMQYDYDNQMISGRTDEFGVACRFGCRYNRPDDSKDSFDNFSPKLGLSYQLNENNSLQIRMQRGFRAPQATELYRLQNNQTVADLDSVELDSTEVAFVGSNDRMDYSATIYFMDKENEIFTNSARENLNDSHTRHEGIEFAAGYDISDNLSIRGVYNLASHTYRNTRISGGIDVEGNDIDTAPNQFGNLRLQWQPNASLLTELEVVNMGDYYTNPENTADYEGHTLLNWRTQYQVNSNLNIALNIMNVTDVDYAERADWTTFTGDRYFPGEPARAFLSANWKLR